MSQQVKYLNIKDLVLWTENPRDPINEVASDQDIVDKALDDGMSKWTLPKLAKEMGDYYDFSELPTVVYHGENPVVYDGNRRMILAKIKHGLVSVPTGTEIEIPEIPEEIPCNVCSKKIALNNVYRKHADSGSWQPLERDVFIHKFMGKEKSPFLILEEDTGLISSNQHLNQRFVKEEIFKEDMLKSLGFEVKGGRLKSVHSNSEAKLILNDISQKIQQKKITTRKNRGEVFEVLDTVSQKLIQQNKNKKLHRSKIRFDGSTPSKVKRQSQRTAKKEEELFGGRLYLRSGDISNLYRDISDLYSFYVSKKENLSISFPAIVRMSLRLLSETAAKDLKLNLNDFIRSNFANAKKALSQNLKTYLHTQQISESNITSLLQTGAHNYSSSSNIQQTIAISIILGSILAITHGKEESTK